MSAQLSAPLGCLPQLERHELLVEPVLGRLEALKGLVARAVEPDALDEHATQETHQQHRTGKLNERPR